MPCKVDVDTSVQYDILNCDDEARHQIGDFLVALQNNAFPSGCESISDDSFDLRLPCGYYVSWQVFGDLMHLALTRDTKHCTIRILGVALDPRTH